jgi:hypothetical protein
MLPIDAASLGKGAYTVIKSVEVAATGAQPMALEMFSLPQLLQAAQAAQTAHQAAVCLNPTGGAGGNATSNALVTNVSSAFVSSTAG